MTRFGWGDWPPGAVRGVSAGVAVLLLLSPPAGGLDGQELPASVPDPAHHPHEPPGFIPFAEHDGSSAPGAQWRTGGIRGAWLLAPPGNPRIRVESDPSAPASPPEVFRTRFPEGMPGGLSPGVWSGWDSLGARRGQKRKVYFSIWMRVGGGSFEGHPVATKVGFFGYGQSVERASNQGFLTLEGGGRRGSSTRFPLGFRQQNHVSRNMFPNMNTSTAVTTGRWHHIEVLMELNSRPGARDGILRIWIDGVQTHEHRDVQYTTPGAENGFYAWKWDPVWGGMGGRRTQTEYIDIDHVYISGIPAGPESR